MKHYETFVKLFNSGNVRDLSVEEIDRFFSPSCEKGHLDIAKWLWDISGHKINIDIDNDWTFRLSCVNGHLDVVKWLWDIFGHKINIHAHNNYAFRFSCRNGHLVVAKWLWEISGNKINIHADNNYIFLWSYLYGKLDVVKWLWEISKFTIHGNDFNIKSFHSKIPFFNKHSIKKYRYNYTNKYDNLHMLHYYYKPVDGPGYLKAINDFQ